MKKIKFLAISLVLVFLVVILTGCGNPQITQNQNSEKGFLVGKITIGPLCPVERIPPDPQCQPTVATYQAWPIAVYSADKKEKIVQLEPALGGDYKIELPIGNYVVDLEKQQSIGFGVKNLPAAVFVSSGQTSILDINIDTGIR